MSTGAGTVARGAAQQPAPPQAAAQQAGPQQAASQQAAATPLQQKDFVQTATIDLRTPDVDGADAKVAAGAARYGGSIQQDQRSGTGPNRNAVITVRIAPAHLAAMMTLARGLGVELNSALRGEDVTAQHADVDARVLALQTSVKRLEGFLSKSASLNDLIQLENQLSTRQAELDSTVAQQNALDSEIAMSSLTVRLSASPVVVVRRTVGPSGFGRAVLNGWHGVVLAGRWTAATVGYALPSALAAALIAVPGFVIVRRVRNPRRAAVAVERPAAGPDPTGPDR
jgi:hypothetical protein